MRQKCATRVIMMLLAFTTTTARTATSQWRLSLRTDWNWLSSSAVDTAGGTTEVDLGTTDMLDIGMGASLQSNAWQVSLSADYGSGLIRANTDVINVADPNTPSRRYRFALLGSYRMVRFGTNELFGGLGPTLDVWTQAGGESTVALGGQAQLCLRIPLGERWGFENRLGFGISASSIAVDDLPSASARGKAMTDLSFGVGLSYRL